MPYLGHKPLSESAPNHPFAHSQISFGVRHPDNLKQPPRIEGAPEESQPRAKPAPRK